MSLIRGGTRRNGWRALLAVAALIGATLAVGAAASLGPAADAWIHIDGDMVVPAALAAEPEARAEGEGYLTSLSGNLGSYDIRLVDSSGVESLRPELEEAAREIHDATSGDMRVLPGVTAGAEVPAPGEILVVVTSASPCSASPWIGCGSVQSTTGSTPNLIATSGKVWLHPDVLGLSAHNRQHVVSHELGHALGLRHYDGRHDGAVQVMHRSSYDALSYRSGDLAGLRFLHDGGPSVPSNDLFASPYALTETLPTMASGSTTGADREPSEPQHAGASGGASVWLSWTAAASGEVTAEIVSSSFDTVLGVYSGSSLAGLTEVASNDDGPASAPLSATRFEATAGDTYRIAVDGAQGERGRFTIRVRPWVAGPFSSDVAFAERQYADFLGAGRPTLTELLTTVESLQSGERTAADVIASLVRHDERLASLAPVTRLYFAYFQRTPDTSGLQYWIGRHRRGFTLSSVSSTFATSSEFDAAYGDLDDEEFVELVYGNVLGRAPDASGALYWVGQLRAGRTRGSLMARFSESSEHVRVMAAEVDVVSLRLGMVRAVPSSALFDANVRELENGNPLQQIADRILTGTTYAALL